MAIYDNNGTTDNKIMGVYENNGSADHEIQKVYDYDGTTNHLVWESREYLIENGSPTDLSQGFRLIKQQYESSWEQKNGYIEMQGLNSGTKGRVDCINKNIDFSKFTTLNIDIGLEGDNPANNYIDIGLSGKEIPDYIWLPDTNPENNITNLNMLIKSRQVKTFNISDVNKKGMLMLSINNATPKYQIYNIWLE